jgi:hypothetical protein
MQGSKRPRFLYLIALQCLGDVYTWMRVMFECRNALRTTMRNAPEHDIQQFCLAKYPLWSWLSLLQVQYIWVIQGREAAWICSCCDGTWSWCQWYLRKGNSALVLAAYYGYVRLFDRLFQLGSSIESRGIYGNAVEASVRNSRHEALQLILVEQCPQDVAFVLCKGPVFPWLQCAICKRNVESVRILISTVFVKPTTSDYHMGNSKPTTSGYHLGSSMRTRRQILSSHGTSR